MRWLGWMFPILAAAAALVISPASVMAATTYSDSISGYEYAATSTHGSFAGMASGALFGAWSATVDHAPLGASATIKGGDFHLATYVHGATYLHGTPTGVSGDFTGGTVKQVSGFTGCVNQQYAVAGVWATWALVQPATAPAPLLPR